MKLLIRCLAALALLAGWSTVARAEEEKERDAIKLAEISLDKAEAKLKAKAAVFYDCNSPETFAAGHVPGAKWVKYDAVGASDLPADKKATLIFYCANEH
jgi:hypothetical protein